MEKNNEISPFTAFNSFTGNGVEERFTLIITREAVLHIVSCSSFVSRIVLFLPVLRYLGFCKLVSEFFKLLVGLLEVVVFLEQLAILELSLAAALVEGLTSTPLPRGSSGAPSTCHASAPALVVLVLVVLIVVMVRSSTLLWWCMLALM